MAYAQSAAACRDLIKYYEDRFKFKGDVRRQAFIAVAFFYTARAEFSMDMICAKLNVIKEDFNGALRDLSRVLRESVEHRALLHTPRSDLIPMLTRMINECMPEKHKSAIRQTAVSIYDKIRGDESIRTCQDESVTAVMIYMACNIMKLGITYENMFAWYGSIEATMQNIERRIQDILWSTPPTKRIKEVHAQALVQQDNPPAKRVMEKSQATPVRFQSALVRYGSAGGLSDEVCMARAAARRSMRHGQTLKLSRSATM